MKKILLITFLLFTATLGFTQTVTLYKDGFTDPSVVAGSPSNGNWTTGTGYTITHGTSVATITGDGSTGGYTSIAYSPYDNPQMGGTLAGPLTVDMSATGNDSVFVVVRSSVAGQTLRVDIQDVNGYTSNNGQGVTGPQTMSTSYTLLKYKFTAPQDGAYGGTCPAPGPCTVDKSSIDLLLFYVNAATGGFNGVMEIDYVQMGGTSATVPCTFTPTANAGGAMTISHTATATLNGSVTNATGGTWSGGAGTYSPNANTLIATYTPTATEQSAGTVTLTLTTTGSGVPSCTAGSDTKVITISAASGITNAYINANINLYPNPTTGLVKVENNSTFTVTGVSVINPSGSEVFNQNGDLKSVDLGNLNKGIYFMKVETNGGSLMKKIVLE
jgi:hypothetical protein